MTSTNPWRLFQLRRSTVPEIGLTLDAGRMAFDDSFLNKMKAGMTAAFDAMAALEQGALANPDEQRMVGHYWLRAPHLAPSPALRTAIEEAAAAVRAFAAAVHSGAVKPPNKPRFSRLLSIGIGGSALGPMFVSDALGDPATDKLLPHFIDNTDPDGIARVLRQIGPALDETLCVVTSKSGGTPEPRTAALLVAAAFTAAGLDFARQAVAVTSTGSSLDQQAERGRWLARFPMWDWVGGRTSETSAVGLLPAALQGLDVAALLEGAAACDAATRGRDMERNPAALLALSWFHATNGRGAKDMVVLPYKDRLILFSRYLQQLVMESLGKRLDLEGKVVEQGISVYGNKGSTDQHAYVQQLRDGVHNFFVVFIRVLEAGGDTREVEPGVTAGDYLHAFLLGTRAALAGNGRQSVTISVPRVDARTVGALIALFERAVGFYASLTGINAYHQPGVEAGKKAAAGVLALQARLGKALGPAPQTVAQLASAAGSDDLEAAYLLLEHLAANGRATMTPGPSPGESTFFAR